MYKSREEIPANEKWDLTDIFKSKDEWEASYKKVEQAVESLQSYKDQLHTASDLFEFLTLDEETSLQFKHLYVYAMLSVDINTKDHIAQSLLDRAKHLSVKYSSAKSFFMPYLLNLEETTLKNYIKEIEGLKYFEQDLLESYRYKKHVLSKEEEAILSKVSEAFSGPSHTFSMINNADIKFGKVTVENNEKVELTRGMYTKLMKSTDRNKRKEAYKAYYEPYLHLQNTIASTLSAAIKNNVTTSHIRHYESALVKALFPDQVPEDVFQNLITTTKSNLDPLYKYQDIRKQVLQIEDLRAYDLNVPLVSDVQDSISFDEAFKIMLDGLAPLGKEYCDTLRSFKDQRYFDVHETEGKRSGAYNIGVYGVHPFVLLNHHNDLNSLFTLAHESGHAMHSYYSSKYQPQITSGYSIFVAEVASTVNEILLIRHLLATTEDQEQKKYLLNHFIDGFKGTFFTQVMFSEFEQQTHERAENGEPLNATVFNEIYEKIFRHYHGESFHIDEEVKYGWARIPHFYRPFYVYKYATGYAAAMYIADKILANDNEMLNNYLQFLQSGSSAPPLELLKATGVDLSKPTFIEDTIRVFAQLVDELAEQMNK